MREVTFFYGEDCPHCKKMHPIVKEIVKEIGAKFKFLEIWYDEENADYMRSFSKIIEDSSQNHDLSVPTFLDIKNKEAIVGSKTKEELIKWIMEK
jgi:thiol-disulfide isomerase/thioredoxin